MRLCHRMDGCGNASLPEGTFIIAATLDRRDECFFCLSGWVMTVNLRVWADR